MEIPAPYNSSPRVSCSEDNAIRIVRYLTFLSLQPYESFSDFAKEKFLQVREHILDCETCNNGLAYLKMYLSNRVSEEMKKKFPLSGLRMLEENEKTLDNLLER